MDRFFKYVQRINSLLPLLAILFILAGICWAILQDHNKPKAAVQAPKVTGQAQQYYFLNQSQYLEKNGIWIFHLDASEQKSWDYEMGRYQTHNLLLIPDNQESAHWVFKDQAQLIQKLETYPDNKNLLAKALYIEVKPISEKDTTDADEDNFTIYLAKLNGDKPVIVLSHVDKVIGHNLRGDILQIIYQQGLSVMRAQISIDDFKVRSNREVAKMTGVPSK